MGALLIAGEGSTFFSHALITMVIKAKRLKHLSFL